VVQVITHDDRLCKGTRNDFKGQRHGTRTVSGSRFPVLAVNGRLQLRKRRLHRSVNWIRTQADDILGHTFSSMTCPTRSAASPTRLISSSSERTRPPTRSAVWAVAETLVEKLAASTRSSSRRGTRVCNCWSDLSMDWRLDRRSVRELESSASAD
jgi:hypothetical protein